MLITSIMPPHVHNIPGTRLSHESSYLPFCPFCNCRHSDYEACNRDLKGYFVEHFNCGLTMVYRPSGAFILAACKAYGTPRERHKAYVDHLLQRSDVRWGAILE